MHLDFKVNQKYKKGVSIRPIVSYISSQLYSLAKDIANILEICVKDGNNNARNVPTEDDKVKVSFNVTSLFKKIPATNNLNVIKDYVHNDDQFIGKVAIPQKKFFDLVNLVLTTF